MNYCNNLKAIENSIKKYQENFLLLFKSNNTGTSIQTNQDDMIIIDMINDDKHAQSEEE
ncbi:1507_t:CDS:2 [Dentiscutata erythropus]|uniref:1507_t:CDS:1 n=1 Tax=Dentiscutata erythropus TaxID=1348616 RepID=A0A9N9FNF4_9GLOM|nr:1507_t:CDS:2 [Dentiscutata erythropus]